MEKCLYLEGASGISGDMTVAALLDLGGSQEKLAKALASLHIEDEFHYHIAAGNSYSIAGCCFNVHCHIHDDHHDHHEHHEHHEHHDEHTEHKPAHRHVHRNLDDVLQIIRQAELSERASALAEKIFHIVAAAEAQAHGCSVEEVHFHEVGAVDSIADIVAAAVLVDDLDITECIVESLTEGCGSVKCQHGALPVPVPAVLNIAQQHRIALRRTAVEGEMVTPTGIAIAAALRTSDQLPEKFRIQKVGIGVGKRDFGHANILRAMLIEAVDSNDSDQVFVLESNLDDATGEQLGYAMEQLLSAGALDVHFTPCFMKKNRPGWLLRVITTQQLIPELEKLIFTHTTTIGIRRYPVERSCMYRTIVEVDTPWGKASGKKCSYGNIERIYPEYESIKQVAENAGVPLQEVAKYFRS